MVIDDQRCIGLDFDGIQLNMAICPARLSPHRKDRKIKVPIRIDRIDVDLIDIDLLLVFTQISHMDDSF